MERTCGLNETHKAYEYEAPKEIENAEMKNLPKLLEYILCGILGAVGVV